MKNFSNLYHVKVRPDPDSHFNNTNPRHWFCGQYLLVQEKLTELLESSVAGGQLYRALHSTIQVGSGQTSNSFEYLFANLCSRICDIK